MVILTLVDMCLEQTVYDGAFPGRRKQSKSCTFIITCSTTNQTINKTWPLNHYYCTISSNIHNTTVDKDKETQFIVTMDGFSPNAFLAKKLMTEGLLNDEEEMKDKIKPKSVLKTTNDTESKNKITDKDITTETKLETVEEKPKVAPKKRSSDTSEDSDTQVIINKEEKGDKRKSDVSINAEEPIVKKRKASPIVFDVGKKEDGAKKRERERTESANNDNHVIVTTTTNTHKYDSLPPREYALFFFKYLYAAYQSFV